MKKLSDRKLQRWAKRISESDQEAFDCFFRSFYPRFVHFSQRYIRNKAAAADVVQEAFVILWEKRRSLDPNRSIKAYMYRIVRNRSLNYLRDHSKETVGLEKVRESRLKTGTEHQQWDENGINIPLKKWIEELPDRQREAFKLSRFEGLEHNEIADVMNISVHTVNNHIVAALGFLRSCYEQFSGEEKNYGS